MGKLALRSWNRPLPLPFRGLPVLLITCALGVAGCGGAPVTPEDQVRARLDSLEAAAEAGDVAGFTDLISETYEDPFGHDKERLTAMVKFQVLRAQRGREVVLRVREVQLLEEGRAGVTAHIGLMGSGDVMRGSVYALEADFALESDHEWRVIWARWKPAAPAELL